MGSVLVCGSERSPGSSCVRFAGSFGVGGEQRVPDWAENNHIACGSFRLRWGRDAAHEWSDHEGRLEAVDIDSGEKIHKGTVERVGREWSKSLGGRIVYLHWPVEIERGVVPDSAVLLCSDFKPKKET